MDGGKPLGIGWRDSNRYRSRVTVAGRQRALEEIADEKNRSRGADDRAVRPRALERALRDRVPPLSSRRARSCAQWSPVPPHRARGRVAAAVIDHHRRHREQSLQHERRRLCRASRRTQSEAARGTRASGSSPAPTRPRDCARRPAARGVLRAPPPSAAVPGHSHVANACDDRLGGARGTHASLEFFQQAHGDQGIRHLVVAAEAERHPAVVARSASSSLMVRPAVSSLSTRGARPAVRFDEARAR